MDMGYIFPGEWVHTDSFLFAFCKEPSHSQRLMAVIPIKPNALRDGKFVRQQVYLLESGRVAIGKIWWSEMHISRVIGQEFEPRLDRLRTARSKGRRSGSQNSEELKRKYEDRSLKNSIHHPCLADLEISLLGLWRTSSMTLLALSSTCYWG